MKRLDTENYSLFYGIGRIFVRISYWIASICLFIAVVYYSFMVQVDEELVFNVSKNALLSPDGLMKFLLFTEIITFPIIACIQIASFAFLIFAIIIATKLILKSKEVIGAILFLASALCYFQLMALPEMDESSFSTLSLTVIILFIITGVYVLARGAGQSNLGILSLCMILFGLEMIWPRHYQLTHHTRDYSGFWMMIISLAAIFFLLSSSKFLLCEPQEFEIEESEVEEVA